MSFQQLYKGICEDQYLKRFTFSEAVVKQRLEELIARGYCERDENDRKVYHYVAWTPRNIKNQSFWLIGHTWFPNRILHASFMGMFAPIFANSFVLSHAGCSILLSSPHKHSYTHFSWHRQYNLNVNLRKNLVWWDLLVRIWLPSSFKMYFPSSVSSKKFRLMLALAMTLSPFQFFFRISM